MCVSMFSMFIFAYIFPCSGLVKQRACLGGESSNQSGLFNVTNQGSAIPGYGRRPRRRSPNNAVYRSHQRTVQNVVGGRKKHAEQLLVRICQIACVDVIEYAVNTNITSLASSRYF